MGRLFWKFFSFFWLAQFVTSLGVGVAVWILHPDHPPPPPPSPQEMRVMPGDRPPPPVPPNRAPMPLLPILAGSVVSLLFAAWLAWYFARPIRNLRMAFAATADGQLDTRIGKAMGPRHDELADLGGDFDRMAERLQTLIDSQRRLLHDVSHELRSPLARLQAASELMRQQPERAAELIARIERDTLRMDRLVGELLTLARLDAGMAGASGEPVDLGGLVEEVVADVRVEAEPRHCRIDLDLAKGQIVAAQAELLRRAIENVLRNALHYSPPGGLIHIAMQPAGRQVVLTVADAGPGVDADELAVIFEPFHRARNADSSQAGHGLGLAITRRVMQVHGGRVSAANRPTGGLVVSLELPVAG